MTHELKKLKNIESLEKTNLETSSLINDYNDKKKVRPLFSLY